MTAYEAQDATKDYVDFKEIRVHPDGKFIYGVDKNNTSYQFFYYTPLQYDIDNDDGSNGYIPPCYGAEASPDRSPGWPNYLIELIEKYRPVMWSEGMNIPPEIDGRIRVQERDGAISGKQVTFGYRPLYYVHGGNNYKEKSRHPTLFEAVTQDERDLKPPKGIDFPGPSYGP